MSIPSRSKGGVVNGKGTAIEYYALIVVIRILYDFMYRTSIYPIYAYAGFKYEFGMSSYIISWTVLIVVAVLVKKLYENRENKISAEVLFIIFLVMFIPFTTMIGYQALTISYIVWNVVYYLVLYTVYQVARNIRGVRIRTVSRGHSTIAPDELLIAIAIVSMLVVLYISGRYTNFRFNFSLINVYDLRLEAREFNLPTILDYLFAWTKVLLPVLIAIFMRQRKWIMVVACFLTVLLSFGIDGAKAPLFMAIVVVIVQVLPVFNTSMMNKWLVRGLALILLLGSFEYRAFNTMFLSSSIFRRMSFLTNLISSWYYDFFSSHTPDYFKGSFLRYIGFHSEYTEGVARMIGRLYMHNAATNANNGMIADAFANLGYAGILIMPILMIVVLKLLDKYAKGLDLRIYIVISLYIAIQLMNSFLATAFLTGGILGLMILLSILDREKMAEMNPSI